MQSFERYLSRHKEVKKESAAPDDATRQSNREFLEALQGYLEWLEIDWFEKDTDHSINDMEYELSQAQGPTKDNFDRAGNGSFEYADISIEKGQLELDIVCDIEHAGGPFDAYSSGYVQKTVKVPITQRLRDQLLDPEGRDYAVIEELKPIVDEILDLDGYQNVTPHA